MRVYRRAPIAGKAAVAVLTVTFTTLMLLWLVGCGAQVDVPDIGGLDLAAATTAIESSGFELGSVDYDRGSTETSGTVISQQPSPGESAASGSAIHLVIAGGEPREVPELTGIDVGAAIIAAEQAGLSAAVTVEEHSETVPETFVISQLPAPGATAPEGSTIELVISLGTPPPPSDTLTMSLVDQLTGDMTPKSVVAAPNGLVFAQNMIYRHTVSVLDADTRKLVKTIPDAITPSDFGFSEWTKPVKGGPVEAAVAADGKSMYVSNYSMYGPGFSHPGDDEGGPNSGVDDSFVYRIPFDTLEVDQVIRVGAVPKYLATTPDGRYLLVSNWISYSVSVVDVATGKEIRQIDVGRFPRGLAVTDDSRYAYVAIMGSTQVGRIDLETFELEKFTVGSTPRHIVISPDNRYLYITLNLAGKVVKYDLNGRKVVGSVTTGSQPRSMAMAPDGRSLYVVNYESDSVSKVRTSDMRELQEIKVGHHPIGITYVESHGEIWACTYGGTIYVFEED